MASEEPIKQGLLMFPPHSVLGQLKKSWHKKYCQLFRASHFGIQRLEMWDSREDILTPTISPRILTLEACVKIVPGNQPKIITVTTKSSTHHIGCYTESEVSEWIAAFQQVAFGDAEDSQIEKDNDLYSISSEGIFSVKLIETPASKRCQLEPKIYTLILCVESMKLVDKESTLFVWPYKYIRKYGHKDGKFTFEAGRKCESGEGSFHLEHGNHQEIFRSLRTKMKFMKKLLSADSGASLHPPLISPHPSINFNELQYHPGLSMEAGSRSPLPANLSSHSASTIDMDYTMKSHNSQCALGFSSCGSLDSVPYSRPSPPVTFTKPDKLPKNYSCYHPNLHQQKDNSKKKYPMKNSHSTTTLDHLLPKKEVVFYQEDDGDDNYDDDDDRCDEDDDTDLSAASAITTSTTTLSATTAFIPNENNSNNDDNHLNNKVHRYDQMEIRENAWKTCGIDFVPHTENTQTKRVPSINNRTNINTSNDEINECDNKYFNRNKSTKKVSVNKNKNYDTNCHSRQIDEDNNNVNNGSTNTSSNTVNSDNNFGTLPDEDDVHECDNDYDSNTNVFHEKIDSSKNTTSPILYNSKKTKSAADYDKLQHIVPLYKTNDSETYKKIYITPGTSSKSSGNSSLDELPSPSWDDYDIVEDISAIKINQNNSHRSGVINKKSNNDKSKINSSSSSSSSQYQVFNNTDYAMVSKPKRV